MTERDITRGGGGDALEAGNHDCLAKRRDGEPMFILLGRDPDAHNIVRAWAERRLAAGGDPRHCQLGLQTAERMRAYAAEPANRPASAPEASSYPPAAHPSVVGASEPVAVTIFCPVCSVPHVDEDEWATTRHHKTHQCQACGHEWRPFPFATVGVAPPAQPLEAENITTEAGHVTLTTCAEYFHAARQALSRFPEQEGATLKALAAMDGSRPAQEPVVPTEPEDGPEVVL